MKQVLLTTPARSFPIFFTQVAWIPWDPADIPTALKHAERISITVEAAAPVRKPEAAMAKRDG